MASTTTRGQITTDTYLTLWIPSDSPNFPLSLVQKHINNVVRRITNGRIASLTERDSYGNDRVYQCGNLSFREKNIFYTNIPTTTLTDWVETSDVTISFDTTNFPTSGAIYVWGEIITYTGKTSSTVTGVSWLLTTHIAWDTVYALYSLPSDITKPFSLNRIDYDWNRRDIDYQDSRYPASHFEYFSVVTSNTWVNYILLRSDSTNDKLLFTYFAASTDMDEDSDICVIPDEYVEVVSALTAWELNWKMSETAEAQTQLRKAYAMINEMFGYFNDKIKRTHKTIKARPASFRSVIWYGRNNNN